jgi:ABC-type branched-subunit amino acid transport system ATPase component
VFVKVVSFAIASFIAGIAGCLLAYRQSIITWESFAAIAGLTIVSTAYLSGITSVFGGVQAGIIGAGGVIYYILSQLFSVSGDTFIIVTGILLIFTLMRNPEGVAVVNHELADKFWAWRAKRKRTKEPVVSTPPAPAAIIRTPPTAETPILLEVEALTVQYGGVTAVSEIALRVPAGGIVGLIGPNGAGKTSAIDAITGFAKATGKVTLDGSRIDGLATHLRVRRGLARTFQQLELYDDLTVEENVSAAAFGVKGEARRGAVQHALDLVGIGELRERDAGDLSQGQRQLVSIARACAAAPKVILLDEPAAGLDTTESRWLGDRVRNISANGTGILLVDHDVALVLDICDYIYVLDFGEVIAEGDAAHIRANRAVADAYLGHAHATETVTA